MTSKRPTIHEVAAKAGVSKSLVSLALRGSPKVSPASSEAIHRAAAELGYRPNATARSLAYQRSSTIGINMAELDNPIFPQILSGAHEIAREHGFHTLLVSGEKDPDLEREELTKLLELQVEGLILVSHRMTESTVRSLASEVPTVVITMRGITGPGIDAVATDDDKGAHLAMEHLFGLGHERIAHISGGEIEPGIIRERIYREAMERQGLSAYVQVVPGDMSNEGGLEAARTLITASGRPTAIFASNDNSAIGAIAACKERNLDVPRDISIIGFDGAAIGGLSTLDLTTIAQPLRNLGTIAAQRLFDRIDGTPIEGREIVLEPTLLARGTTGPPGA